MYKWFEEVLDKLPYFHRGIIKTSKTAYVYEEVRLGWLRFSYYRYGKKFTIRFEISRGW